MKTFSGRIIFYVIQETIQLAEKTKAKINKCNYVKFKSIYMTKDMMSHIKAHPSKLEKIYIISGYYTNFKCI